MEFGLRFIHNLAGLKIVFPAQCTTGSSLQSIQ
jgi:hypothetical protein